MLKSAQGRLPGLGRRHATLEKRQLPLRWHRRLFGVGGWLRQDFEWIREVAAHADALACSCTPPRAPPLHAPLPSSSSLSALSSVSIAPSASPSARMAVRAAALPAPVVVTPTSMRRWPRRSRGSRATRMRSPRAAPTRRLRRTRPCHAHVAAARHTCHTHGAATAASSSARAAGEACEPSAASARSGEVELMGTHTGLDAAPPSAVRHRAAAAPAPARRRDGSHRGRGGSLNAPICAL